MHVDLVTPPRPAQTPPDADAQARVRPSRGGLAGRPDRGRVSFVDLLDASARRDLDSLGSLRAIGAGRLAFLQGEHPARVAIVESGLFKLTAEDDAGRTVFLGLRGSGDVIGLAASWDGSARSSSATSIGDAVIRMVDSAEFGAFVDRRPSAARASSRVLAERIRESVAHRLRMVYAVPERLAHQLLELSADYGTLLDGGAVLVELAVTQDDLATMIDASRDSVAKTLMQWRRQQIVETARRRITILDPRRLALLP